MEASSEYQDLDNDELRERLQKSGLTIKIGRSNAYLKVQENGSTGFTWLVDEAACDDSIVSMDTHVGREQPVNRVQPSSDDAAMETVVARSHMVGVPGERYFTLTGESEGECKLRLFYARPWSFSFENEA